MGEKEKSGDQEFQPETVAKIKLPDLGCCRKCGEHKAPDCEKEMKPCQYKYCGDERINHCIEACPELHRICEKCYLRGHRVTRCPINKTKVSANNYRRYFESVADKGYLTRTRHNHPAWGIYYFGARRYWKEGKFQWRHRALDRHLRDVDDQPAAFPVLQRGIYPWGTDPCDARKQAEVKPKGTKHLIDGIEENQSVTRNRNREICMSSQS